MLLLGELIQGNLSESKSKIWQFPLMSLLVIFAKIHLEIQYGKSLILKDYRDYDTKNYRDYDSFLRNFNIWFRISVLVTIWLNRESHES